MGNAGLACLKIQEKLKLKSYRDLGRYGKWTIGWGHTSTAGPGQVITVEEAEDLLRKDLRWAEDAYAKLVIPELPQLAVDAVIMFIYNIGEPAFAKSTFLKRINRGDWLGAQDALGWFVYSMKKRLFGLGVRRGMERGLFIAGMAEINVWKDLSYGN
jgi:lysozyme